MPPKHLRRWRGRRRRRWISSPYPGRRRKEGWVVDIVRISRAEEEEGEEEGENPEAEYKTPTFGAKEEKE